MEEWNDGLIKDLIYKDFNSYELLLFINFPCYYF